MLTNPSRGLLRDCTTSPINRLQQLPGVRPRLPLHLDDVRALQLGVYPVQVTSKEGVGEDEAGRGRQQQQLGGGGCHGPALAVNVP